MITDMLLPPALNQQGTSDKIKFKLLFGEFVIDQW